MKPQFEVGDYCWVFPETRGEILKVDRTYGGENRDGTSWYGGWQYWVVYETRYGLEKSAWFLEHEIEPWYPTNLFDFRRHSR